MSGYGGTYSPPDMKYVEEEIRRGDKAMGAFSKMVKGTNLLYYRLEGLLDDGLNNWVAGGAYMVLVPPTRKGSGYDPVGVKFYVDGQDSLRRSKDYPDGMFMIRVARMGKSIPEVGGRMHQFYCTYVEDEDKFYFKPMSLLRSYSKKLTGKRALSFNRRLAVLNNPKEDSTGEHMIKEAAAGQKFLKEIHVGDYVAPIENPLYCTQDEFMTILSQASEHISNYPAEMKLSFKILRNTLARFGRS